ncbi:MAG: porin family protein [Chryseolinea sp.]
MKKQNIIIAGLLVFFAVVTSFDTQAQRKVWSIGPEAGISISSYGMDASSNDSKVGGIVGGFVTYSIVNTFAITTKLLYYQKGASFPSSNTKQTLHYLEVPVIGRFFLNKEGSFRPNIFLGPSFGFLNGASQKVGNNDRAKIDSYKNIYNNVDVGITGGVGFNFLVANETYLILDARYTHGLSDISKANGDVNNNSLALTAGLSFGF